MESNLVIGKLGLKGVVVLIVASFMATAIGAVSVSLTAHYLLAHEGFFFYEILLPLVLVYGVVSLLIALAVMAAILADFGLSNKNAALGLPDGSIRAVLAISLVLIFIVTALYVYSRETGKNEDSRTKEMSMQLTTTVGTLAVAVAGFYFGSKAVEAGAAAARPIESSPIRLRIVSPTSPTSPPPAGEALEVTVETVPKDQTLTTYIFGDTDGTLAETAPGSGRWRYTPGQSAAQRVLLRFSIVNHPGTDADLEIRQA